MLVLLALAASASPAEWAARMALEADPADADAWADLARAVDGDPELARELVDHALRLDPECPDALVESGRLWLVTGAEAAAADDFRRALAVDPDAWEAAVGLARATGDADLAEGTVARFPSPAVALALRPLLPDPEGALLGVDAPDAGVYAALADLRLRDGDADGARGWLDRALALDPTRMDALRLAPWARCVDAGTLDGAGYADARALRRGIGDGAWLATSACPAALVQDGAVASLRRAVALDPDPLHVAALGRAVDDPAEAADLLEAALAARPWDGALVADLARALGDAGDPERAREVLADARYALPDDPHVLVATAEAAGGSDGLDLLISAIDRTHDDLLTAPALALAEDLGRVAEVERVLGPRRPAPPPRPVDSDGTSSEIVVWGTTRSDAARAALEAHLLAMGYGPPRPGRDGDLVLSSQDDDLPTVTLHPDGLVDMARTAGNKSRRKTFQDRAAVLGAMQPQLIAWRAALGIEGFDLRLATDLPERLDALWRDGVPLAGGPPLADPAARRAALLDYWATRTCTPEGDRVRAFVARYLALEVQASAAPLTAAEVAAANDRRSCDLPLTVPEP